MNALLLFALAAAAQPLNVPIEGGTLVLDAKHAPKGVKPEAWAKSVAAGVVAIQVGGAQVWTKPAPQPAPEPPKPAPVPEPAKPARAPEQDAFWKNLAALCGKAFAGAIAADQGGAPGKPDPFAGKALVMHVRECAENEIRVPFHVGDDRSRTWVFTRTDSGLRLKHDHRHKDGSEDAVTLYGGDTKEPGSAGKQSFPADDFSKAMFQREKMAAAVDNSWIIGMLPGKLFSYALMRPGRLFMVDFDLTREVAAPPAPWGQK